MNQICVVGSLNVDTTITFKTLPQVGETIAGKSIKHSAGGKGFNQAITASRLGSQVSFVGAIGRDERGEFLQAILTEEEIDQEQIAVMDDETGQAFVAVDEAGKNMILMYGGANEKVTRGLVQEAEAKIAASDVVISQFEIPEEAVLEAFRIAREKAKLTILNPAPGKTCSEELLAMTDYLIPNETELELVTGGKPLQNQAERIQAARDLLKLVRKAVIVTLGDAGSLLVSAEGETLVPAKKVKAVDTTAAGDSFIGTFAHCIQTQPVEEAIQKATEIAAIVVAREGAYTSIPTKQELREQ
ncbi:ribokinase [Listeria kieliensis]|uniref:Ribokinase n=1 Tax=Listeria kieliensis TaxID=1621700 RepID=A0A3D8TTC4_9LIST|nr:ribokinase [Listeria kieliensis]RDX02039.1 ribokinase [Listeria kieliensis]